MLESLEIDVVRFAVADAIDHRSRSQDRILGFFTNARWGKKFANTITHEPLQLA